MADIIRVIPMPAEKDSPFVQYQRSNLIGTDVVFLKAGFINGDVPKIYRVKYAAIKCTTDGTVKNRNITIQSYAVNGEQSQNIIYSAGGNIAASSTDTLVVGETYAATNGGTVPYDVFGWKDLIIQGNDYMKFSIYNNAAGDAWEVWAQLEYLNRKLGVTGI